MITHQASRACTSCGSWYRNGPACNICGTACDDPAEAEHRHIPTGTGGRQWSKNLHRYLTEREIKQGMRGG